MCICGISRLTFGQNAGEKAEVALDGLELVVAEMPRQ